LTEADLAALGVHRICVPIPFAAAGGPVNVYAVEDADGGIFLVDSGLGSRAASEALTAGLAALGHDLADVRRLVLTHGHVDHYGGGRALEELHTARHGRPLPVFAHPADVPKLAESGWRWGELAPYYAAHLARLGLAPDDVAAVGREGEQSFTMARRLARVEPLAEGARLTARALDLEVLHMPGHTPGLLCLYDRAHRLLVSSDHLLERTSPNPLIELGPDGRDGFFRPLVTYAKSLARTRALEVDLVLPGHGPPFSGHRAVIDGLLRFYERRQRRLAEALGEGPRTAFELSQALFPVRRPGELFLMVSETVANLEVMELAGVVVRTEQGGTYRYGLS
jgi:glyoxylase-like metal-dependent hydrolase (beta-lactamase superfamily II)